jgi:hypothetical protein
VQAVSGRGAAVERDWRRVPLPRDVLPGETVTIQVDLRDTPQLIETIRLDLVSELRAWFEDHGSQVVEYPMRG